MILALLRQLKRYRIFDAYIEIAECSVIRKAAHHQRLDIELHTLIRLAVVEERCAAAIRMQIQHAEIGIYRQIHTYFVRMKAELFMLVHVVDAAAYLRMRHDIEIPFHRHRGAAHMLTRHKLVIRHVVEIVVIAVVFAIRRDLGYGRSGTV